MVLPSPNFTEARLVEVSTSPGTANDMEITPLGTPTSDWIRPVCVRMSSTVSTSGISLSVMRKLGSRSLNSAWRSSAKRRQRDRNSSRRRVGMPNTA